MNYISKLAKVVSEDGKAYEEKIKTPSGFKWVYSPSHISRRVKEKHSKLQRLERNIDKLTKKITKDLTSDDLRVRAIAAVVQIIIDTAMRVGNVESAKEADTYGATTLKLKHITLSGNKAKFDFPGKKSVHQEQETHNAKVIKVLKELIKGKKSNDFVFEIEGKRVWDRAINRYLEPFGVSAKDLRGYKANEIMKEVLKKHDWEEALEETADIVGHTATVLKNEYLDPGLVKKYEGKDKKACISKRADLLPEDQSFFDQLKEDLKDKLPKLIQTEGIKPGAKTNQLILDAWRTLKPFLPPGVILTSGVRIKQDQERILRYYWRKSGAERDYPDVKDPREQSRILKHEYGYLVNAPGTSPHEKGRCFDLSGGSLDQIAQAVKFVSSNQLLPVQFKEPIVERVNNAVHVDIVNARFDPAAIMAVLNSLDGRKIASVESEYDINQVYEDFLASNPPEELVKELKDLFGTVKTAEVKVIPLDNEIPKKCNCCGKTYDTLEQYLSLPFKKESRPILKEDDPGLQCWAKYGMGEDFVYRDCECGSTLVIRIRCIHSPKEQDAKDEVGKYEREKDDKKWDEVLIDKEGVKLTRRQIRDHYVNHKDQIMKEIKGKPLMLYIGTDKNESVLKKHHNDKPIIINDATRENSGNPDNLIYWIDRRLLSLHHILPDKTTRGFVDLDLHDFPIERAKSYAKEVVAAIKDELGVKAEVWESGGTGLHIEFDLGKEVDIDDLRKQLKDMLDKLNEGKEDITTGIVKGRGLRSDISTLHSGGSLRVRHSLGETYGREKKPLK